MTLIKIISCIVCIIFFFQTISVGMAKNHEIDEIFSHNIPKMVFSDKSYDMMIIGPDVFSDELQKLVNHKNCHGIDTFFKSTEEIYNEFSGRDHPEQIKYCIKNAIEINQIKYVLLIGGRVGQSFQWYLPPRYSRVDDGYMHMEFLCDLYYADIYNNEGDFEDWDSNGDGIYSEWKSDGSSSHDVMDLRPDVAVGRLPCRSEEELAIVIDKIINYENNSYGQSWTKNVLLVGGDTNPGLGDPFPFEGEADCKYTAQLLANYSVTELYTSDESLKDHQDFISSFNQGNLFVLFHGHGLQKGLFTHDKNGELITVFDVKYVSDLVNDDMCPIMIVGCCLTTEFDVGIFNFLQVFKNLNQHYYIQNWKYECVPEVISWNLIKKPDGGTIAHIGDSSTAWGMMGDLNRDGIPDSVMDGLTTGLCAEFFRIIKRNDTDFLGDVYQETLTTIIDNFSGFDTRLHWKNVQEFQLIGDPSLKIGGYN